MLRRAARVTRIGLLGLGAVLLVLLPLSTFIRLTIETSIAAGSETTFVLHSGQFLCSHWANVPFGRWRVDVDMTEIGLDSVASLPTFQRGEWSPGLADDRPSDAKPSVWTHITIPLWLLAFLCLAWPVTSFILHRRRHKRGFPIEPSLSTPLPRAPEVPSERSE